MKNKAMEEALKVCAVELLCMPLFLYTYTPEKTFFWAILIVMDGYILNHYHVMEFGRMMVESEKEERRTLTLLNLGVVLGYMILAYKNMLLASYLVINDLMMNVFSIFLYMKSLDK